MKSSSAKSSRSQIYQTALDYLGPLLMLLVFFGLPHSLSSFDRMLWSSAGLILGSFLAICLSLIMFKTLALLPSLYGCIAIVFGLTTLVFHDPTIIKMKTTAINTLLGLGLMGGYAIGQSPIKLLMGKSLPLSEKAWRQLTLRFGVFFLILAITNEIVWRTQQDSTWVLFHMPGLLIITFLFSLFQIPLLLKGGAFSHVPEPTHDKEETP